MKVSSSEDVHGDNSGMRRDARRVNGEEAGRTDVTTSLPRALRTLEAPGDYFGAGEVVLPVVRIHVEGVGLLGLPIVPAQAEALAKVGADAPYGRGPDTLVDPAVRRCKQIDAASIRADDPRWETVLRTVVEDARRALGVEDKVDAELYKALVYEPGGFFVTHRDTPKRPGMFATLVVSLPAEHEGGELVVRHDGRETTLDLASREVGLLRWAAFYADCQHELCPLRSGYRVALVYNLIRRSGRTRIPDSRPQIATVAEILRDWAADEAGPVKVVMPLAHRYTPSELSFATLKNEDAAAAQVLAGATREAACVLRLAMISIEETGSAEPSWDPWSRSRRSAAREEYKVIEIFERTCRLDQWRTPEDDVEARGAVLFEDSELAPSGALDDEVPDEDALLEATGNEGASFERTYRRAALVVWPASRELEVVWQGGVENAVAALERLAAEPSREAEAALLAAVLTQRWNYAYRRSEKDARLRARTLDALRQLTDREHLSRFVRALAASGAIDETDYDAWVNALDALPPEAVSDALAALGHTAAPRRLHLVARLVQQRGERHAGSYLRPALESLVTAISAVEKLPTWERPQYGERVASLVHSVRALDALEAPDLAALACDAILADAAYWKLDGVVIRALRDLAAGAWPTRVSIARLVEAAVTHLQMRVALPLAPPENAAREATGLACKCADCAQFRSFLASKVDMTWTFKAAQMRRGHVEQTAKNASVDVDMRTERRGSPHALVVTKNTRSYEARVRQRADDLAALAELSESTSSGR